MSAAALLVAALLPLHAFAARALSALDDKVVSSVFASTRSLPPATFVTAAAINGSYNKTIASAATASSDSTDDALEVLCGVVVGAFVSFVLYIVWRDWSEQASAAGPAPLLIPENSAMARGYMHAKVGTRSELAGLLAVAQVQRQAATAAATRAGAGDDRKPSSSFSSHSPACSFSYPTSPSSTSGHGHVLVRSSFSSSHAHHPPPHQAPVEAAISPKASAGPGFVGPGLLFGTSESSLSSSHPQRITAAAAVIKRLDTSRAISSAAARAAAAAERKAKSDANFNFNTKGKGTTGAHAHTQFSTGTALSSFSSEEDGTLSYYQQAAAAVHFNYGSFRSGGGAGRLLDGAVDASSSEYYSSGSE